MNCRFPFCFARVLPVFGFQFSFSPLTPSGINVILIHAEAVDAEIKIVKVEVKVKVLKNEVIRKKSSANISCIYLMNLIKVVPSCYTNMYY